MAPMASDAPTLRPDAAYEEMRALARAVMRVAEPPASAVELCCRVLGSTLAASRPARAVDGAFERCMFFVRSASHA